MANDPLAEAPWQSTAALKGARGRVMSLLLGGLILVPTQAMAEEIPFLVPDRVRGPTFAYCAPDHG